MYTLLVLLIEQPFYWEEYRNKPETVIHVAKLDMNLFTSATLVFFAYTC